MPIKPRLTLAELQATDCYTELTPRQKVLVDTFVTSGGDRLLATQTAYKTASGEVARVMAYRVFATPRVIAALAAYFQSEPLEDFKAEVRRAYRSRKLTIAQVRAMELHADMNGWASASLPSVHGRDTRLPEPDQQTPKTSKPRRVDAGGMDAPPPSPKTFDASTDPRVPETAMKVWLDASGALIGYRDENGQDVRL